MKKLFVIAALALCSVTAFSQELRCSFTQKKTITLTGKVFPGEGTVVFKAPDFLDMTFTSPKGDCLRIDGDRLDSCENGKVLSIDTSKSTRFRKMKNTLLSCIVGNYEEAARENDATLITEDKGKVKRVYIAAKTKQPTGYSRIVIDYDKKGVPVRLVLEEFTGTVTEMTFTY